MLLFGPPLLGLALGEGTLWLELLGLPPVAAWLFGGWAVLIIALALRLEQRYPASEAPPAHRQRRAVNANDVSGPGPSRWRGVDP
jgi:hypothetical protein